MPVNRPNPLRIIRTTETPYMCRLKYIWIFECLVLVKMVIKIWYRHHEIWITKKVNILKLLKAYFKINLLTSPTSISTLGIFVDNCKKGERNILIIDKFKSCKSNMYRGVGENILYSFYRIQQIIYKWHFSCVKNFVQKVSCI